MSRPHLLFAAVALATIAGCKKPKPATPASELTLTDPSGQVVSLARPAARVVSLAPSFTEILYAIGADAELVGVTNLCDAPAAAKSKPSVGGFGPKALGTEPILERRPDLVVAVGAYQAPVLDQLKSLGTPVYAAELNRMADVTRVMRDLGQLTGKKVSAEVAVASFEADLAKVDRLPGLQQRPRVLFVVGTNPFLVAGRSSLVGDVLDRAGGDNVLGDDEKRAYVQLGDEAVLRMQPDYILVPDNMGVEPVETLSRRPGWAQLRAVSGGRVRTVPGDLVSRAGPRLPLGCANVRAVLAGGSGAGLDELLKGVGGVTAAQLEELKKLQEELLRPGK